METIMIETPAVVGLAFEVIAGAWGNGADRKKKLESAGYDYDKIQSCVNDLMKVIEKYA